jgi:hypothetical protein
MNRTPSTSSTADSVLSKISCVHSNEMVCDYGNHSKDTKIVRQIVQRLVAHHFGSKGGDVTWSIMVQALRSTIYDTGHVL